MWEGTIEAVADVLHFTGEPEANALIATEPLALLVGFVLDQQVPVQTAFSGPLKLKQRLGRLDATELAGLEPERLDAVFREKPAIHRFPGSMAKRVQELAPSSRTSTAATRAASGAKRATRTSSGGGSSPSRDSAR